MYTADYNIILIHRDYIIPYILDAGFYVRTYKLCTYNTNDLQSLVFSELYLVSTMNIRVPMPGFG